MLASNQKTVILSELGTDEKSFNQDWRLWLTKRQVPAKWGSLTAEIKNHIKELIPKTELQLGVANTSEFIETKNDRNWCR